MVYVSDLAVNRGDEMTPTEVREQPIRVTWNAEPTSYYTLILVGKSIFTSNKMEYSE